MSTDRFWRIVLFSIPAVLVAAGLFRAKSFYTEPGPPSFPWPGDQFVAEYGAVRSSIGHNIYYHGLFGFGRTIRASNIVLVGTSHMELAISAELLSVLTNNRVFNLGLGCGTPAGFGLDGLRVNRAIKKLVIADIYEITEPGLKLEARS